MTSHWKAILGVMAVFILGGICGALSLSLFLGHRAAEVAKHGPEAVVDMLERRLTRHVELDARQKQQIHDLFLQNLQQRKQLQQQIQPQVRQLNWQTFQQINQLLRPDQREAFHQNLDAFRKHLGKFALDPTSENAPQQAVGSNGSSTNGP